MNSNIKFFLTISLGIIYTSRSIAQNALINPIQFREMNRINQLVNPTAPTLSWYDSTHPFLFASTIQNNTKLPVGYNDGAMQPAVGLRQYYTIGFRKQWKKWTLQLQPEIVMAENKKPDGLPDGFYAPNYWYRYYEKKINVIDQPDYNPQGPTTKFYPGQSKLEFTHKNFSAAISTENLWWGPGVYNSLVLTNNSPGFPHIRLGTHKPIQTKIGAITAEAIFGQLYNSNIEPPENQNPNGSPFYVPKINETRFITGMQISWQPKWVSNISVGIINMGNQYNKDISGFDFLPLANFWKRSTRNALGSLFVRYQMPKDHAEIYLEYGRNDKAPFITNIVGDSIAMGFVLGVRKAVLLNSNKGAIVLHVELTQLHLQNARLLWVQENPALPSKTSSWYTHDYVRQGYTNNGKVLGASIGPGSNSQIIGINWVKQLNRIGIQFERVSQNNDYYFYNYFNGLPFQGPNFLYWADVHLSFNARFAWRNFLFAAELKNTKAINYKWVKFGNGGLWDPAPLSDKKNQQVTFSILYRFP